MSPSHDSLLQPASRSPIRVRWTLLDIVIVVVAAFILTTLVLVGVQVINRLDLDFIGDLFRGRELLGNMLLGALIYGLLLLLIYVWIIWRRQVSWRELGFRTPPLLPMLLTIPIFVGQLLLIGIVNIVVTQIVGPFENPQIEALTDPGGFNWLSFFAVFVVGAIIAPIVEETLFRGLLYQWLRARTSILIAVIASATIFAVAHIIPLLFPALFVVGLILTLVYEWTRSLWVTITIHFLQNGMAIVLIFLLHAYDLLPQV